MQKRGPDKLTLTAVARLSLVREPEVSACMRTTSLYVAMPASTETSEMSAVPAAIASVPRSTSAAQPMRNELQNATNASEASVSATRVVPAKHANRTAGQKLKSANIVT